MAPTDGQINRRTCVHSLTGSWRLIHYRVNRNIAIVHIAFLTQDKSCLCEIQPSLPQRQTYDTRHINFLCSLTNLHRYFTALLDSSSRRWFLSNDMVCWNIVIKDLTFHVENKTI